MDGEELELFGRTLERATATLGGAALDDALVELGWPEALADDPRSAVALLFEHKGRAATTSGALDDVLACALGATGGAVVLPELGSASPPAAWAQGRVEVGGLASFRLLRAGRALVPATGPDAPLLTEVVTAELAITPLRGMDPSLGLVAVAGEVTATTVEATAGDRWTEAVRHGRLALGHELVGASAAMLELARVHALGREQFGRPIGAFQAVRHRLAETLVALESARALLQAAWEDGTGVTAAMAKAVAGRAARTAARHCQQVLAGMGFTTEHPFHRYARRVLVLDELLGSARTLTAELGRQVLAERRLPPPLLL